MPEVPKKLLLLNPLFLLFLLISVSGFTYFTTIQKGLKAEEKTRKNLSLHAFHYVKYKGLLNKKATQNIPMAQGIAGTFKIYSLIYGYPVHNPKVIDYGKVLPLKHPKQADAFIIPLQYRDEVESNLGVELEQQQIIQDTFAVYTLKPKH